MAKIFDIIEEKAEKEYQVLETIFGGVTIAVIFGAIATLVSTFVSPTVGSLMGFGVAIICLYEIAKRLGIKNETRYLMFSMIAFFIIATILAVVAVQNRSSEPNPFYYYQLASLLR